MVLITGRQLEHWHTGSMTRRAAVLDAIEPEPVASLHPLDLRALGAKPGDIVTIESRRGEISLYARADDGTPRGAVFVPFCYYEAAANMLTNPALDPFGKIPEFKYCAVRVSLGGPEPLSASSFGGGRILASDGDRITSRGCDRAASTSNTASRPDGQRGADVHNPLFELLSAAARARLDPACGARRWVRPTATCGARSSIGKVCSASRWSAGPRASRRG